MSETIICRCSDVTEDEIVSLIKAGYTSFDEIKRITRVGMGPCQGKTCSQLIMRKISELTGKSMEELNAQTTRPPAVGVKLSIIAKEAYENEN
ncbi:MAG: (2Fe-2S)-binding protein [Clostridia bacterium]